MVIATLKQPRTSLGFIDRVLVSAESFRIPQVVAFNKIDLLDADELAELESIKAMYERIGVQVIFLSALRQTGMVELREILKDKVTLVAGHSGVGKSTLLNLLETSINQSVGTISDFSEKGKHTTTFAEMFPLDPTTFIIDTPGIKEWGLVDMEPQEISDYFPEMREVRLGCKFGARCLHLNEPKCAVIAAVEVGTIAASRYQNYQRMATGEDNRK